MIKHHYTIVTRKYNDLISYTMKLSNKRNEAEKYNRKDEAWKQKNGIIPEE